MSLLNYKQVEVPCVYVDYACFEPEKLEGYLETVSYSEDLGMFTCYTGSPTKEEVRLSDDFFFERGVNFESLLQNLSPQNVESLCSDVLAVYRLRFILDNCQPEAKTTLSVKPLSGGGGGKKSSRAAYENCPEDLFGARVLLQKDNAFHRRDEVVQTIGFLRNTHKIEDKALQQVAAYLSLVGDKAYGRYLVDNDPRLLDALVVKEKDVSDNYFKNQARIIREQGRGEIEFGPEEKHKMIEALQADQKTGLKSWLDYFETMDYPAWYQYLVIEDLSKMGEYNVDTLKYAKRRKGYVGAFPELNREALSLVYEALEKYHSGSRDFDKELLRILGDGGFKALYEYFLKVGLDNEFDKSTTEGEWKTFEQSNDPLDSNSLAESLSGWNTGWCTAGPGVAHGQLKQGDFHVFYSRDKRGHNRAPRIAVRMQDGEVAEIRGIEPEQNLEGVMTKEVEEKIKNLPGGAAYFVKTNNMKTLSLIDDKAEANQELSSEELKFLYEVEGSITGFGYKKDPRIAKLLAGRDLQADLAKAMECRKDQVALGDLQFNGNYQDVGFIQNIKYVHGDLELAHCGQKLQKGLTVKGSLSLLSSDIEYLPEELFVGDDLHAEYMGLKSLPKGLVAETVILNHCKQLVSISEGIQVSNLQLSNSSIQHLPENLKVKTLRARNCENLRQLPKGLTATNIDLSESAIETLPKGLVLETLQARDTKSLKSLPDDINAKNIFLENSGIRELPRLNSGCLAVSGCKDLKVLPHRLNVEYLHAKNSGVEKVGNIKVLHLDLDECHNLQSLPENLNLDVLKIKDCKTLKSLPKNLNATIVAADGAGLEWVDDVQVDELELVRCKNLERLGQGVKAKFLDLESSGIEFLPEGLEVEELHAKDCHSLKQIPFGIKATTISILDSRVEKLPEGLVLENLDARKALYLKTLPADMQTNVLSASESGLSTLPATIKVEDLRLANCKDLLALPDGLQAQTIDVGSSGVKHVGAVDVKSLSLAQCKKLESLSGEIKAENLTLWLCPNLKTLPKGLQVDCLNASNSGVENVEAIQVKTLDLGGCNIKHMANGIKAKKIHLRDSSIEKLPEGLEVYMLSISGCSNLTYLPKSSKIKRFYANGSGLQRLPQDLILQHLDVSDCKNLRSLPKGLIAGTVDASGSGLKTVPEDLDIGMLTTDNTPFEKRSAKTV